MDLEAHQLIDVRHSHWTSESSSWWETAASVLNLQLEQQRTERVIEDLLTELKHCNNLQLGRRIHAKAVETCNDKNMYVVTALLKTYCKCSNMSDAQSVFDNIQKPDVVAWTVLLLGYAENGDGHAALDSFFKMKAAGCAPDPMAYIGALKACTSLAASGDRSCKEDALKRGRELHTEAGRRLNHYVQNMLVDMYGKCGSMVEARSVFDSMHKHDVVSWNALILGYAENAEGLTALDMFSRMKSSCDPNAVTYLAALKACTSLAGSSTGDCLEWGRKIHSEIGHHLSHCVQNTLIDMYGKCGSVAEARSVFDNMQNPDVVSWNALLMGYVDNGQGLATLNLLSRMKATGGCEPNSVTYLAAVKACGIVGGLTLGRKLHSEITEFTPHVISCLVDFYAKCGSMFEAREVFDFYKVYRDATICNALLAGYGRFGDIDSVFELFEGMVDDGVRPDAVTFVCLLLCCSHAGLVEKAREYFDAMTVQYKITPTVVHYNLMVDALGRANKVNEAVEMIRKMPCNPDVVTWMTLLGACRKWKNVEIGKGALQALAEVDNKNSAPYVLMANLYGSNQTISYYKCLT